MRLYQVFSVASLLIVSSARGQEHCPAGRTGATLEELQAQVTTLEAQLAEQKSADPTSDDSPALRSLEERLLSASEELDCAQLTGALDPKGIISSATFVRVPLLYVTDRQPTPNLNSDFYTPQASPTLRFGRINVLINEIGSIQTGLINGTQRVAAPASMGKAQLQQPQALSEQALTNLIMSSTRNRPVRVLLFVHGFNVQFHEAALSAARLATSMNTSLVPIFYSWPSQGAILGYWHDEDEVSAAVLRFTPFLRRLLAMPSIEVVIVGHSMGARIVTRALGELGRNNVGVPSLKNVVLAAADVNTEEFHAQWPSLHQIPGVQWASYDASADVALHLSTFIHRFRRLGESSRGIFIEDGLNVIDASSTTSAIRTFGHSYLNPA